ncbi:MAG TPA: MFS transporter [Clostridiales bacterium]|nr:MAG: putative symporter YagG [Firmicutes bacterium ADurb.Bin262]HOU09396.1 MFS transporter [Clostridiales bacterium]HQH62092.1 MFS transporter [Clostridiales bacterium]HQK72308.1 MFS transporter [Clostridiales bacterium]
MSDKQKVRYFKTFLIGCGFLGSMVVWTIYDPYVSKLLSEKLSQSESIVNLGRYLAERYPALLTFMQAQGEDVGSAGKGFTLVPLFVGFVMTFDNIFGVIFQPLFGRLSDRTHSRFGKRRPYVFIFAPLAAAVFVLIPRMPNVPALMVCIIAFVFFMSLWRSPVMSLMPDLTPPHLRSEANSVISITGGLGAFIALMAGKVLAAVFGYDTARNEERNAVFLFGAVFVILGTLVLAFFVKEKDSRILPGAGESAAELKAARKREHEKLKAMKLTKPERRSLLFMMAALFFLFIGTNSVTTFFALFAAEILGKTTAEATFMLGAFLASGLVGAILAGFLGKKYGRKKVIVGGLCSFIVMFASFAVTKQMWLIWPALVIGGASSMFINVNTLPLVWSIGGVEKVGTFTGYYYTATFSGQVAAPILYGTVRVLTGTYMSLFAFCVVAFIFSLICISQVRHGEALPEEAEKQAALMES